jgi:hypothetical protein
MNTFMLGSISFRTITVPSAQHLDRGLWKLGLEISQSSAAQTTGWLFRGPMMRRCVAARFSARADTA